LITYDFRIPLFVYRLFFSQHPSFHEVKGYAISNPAHAYLGHGLPLLQALAAFWADRNNRNRVPRVIKFIAISSHPSSMLLLLYLIINLSVN
jgi:hypothetical protein